MATMADPRWRQLEKWLISKGVSDFSVYELSAALNLPIGECSSLINAYVVAQRGRRSVTRYTLRRTGRTRSARWHVAEVGADATAIGNGFYEDVNVTARRAFEPDLRRLQALDPATALVCEDMIDAVINGALRVLRVAVGNAAP